MQADKAPIEDNPVEADLRTFRRRHLMLAGLFLLALFVGAGLLSRFYQAEIQHYTQIIADSFGFWGLAVLLLISDSLLSPLPPDLILLIVAKSGLREQWPFYVAVLGVISTMAGSIGWVLGRFLVSTSWAPQFLKDLSLKQSDFVKKFGTWAVILGALTPLPFSVTCWTAGFLKMPYKPFALAASTRFLRIFLYYLALHYSSWFQ